MAYLSDLKEKFGEDFFRFKITLLSGEALVVDGHKGIFSYQSDCVKIKTKNTLIVVEGENLFLSELGSGELTLTGKISGVRLE